jgi:hypothetical protein
VRKGSFLPSSQPRANQNTAFGNRPPAIKAVLISVCSVCLRDFSPTRRSLQICGEVSARAMSSSLHLLVALEALTERCQGPFFAPGQVLSLSFFSKCLLPSPITFLNASCFVQSVSRVLLRYSDMDFVAKFPSERRLCRPKFTS